MLVLAGVLAVCGLAMAVMPNGFGRFAHQLRISIPAPAPVTTAVTRAMGLVLVAAAIVVLIASQ